MTDDTLLDGVLQREGGFSDQPADRGSFTKFGITAKTLGLWRKLGRQATRAEVQALGLDEARAILRHLYIVAPGFDAITDPALRALVVDDGILSGQATATMALQRALGVTVDGVFGPQTRAALAATDPVVAHVRVVKARLVRYAQIVEKDRTQGDFIEGWIVRALGFLDDHGRPRA